MIIHLDGRALTVADGATVAAVVAVPCWVQLVPDNV